MKFSCSHEISGRKKVMENEKTLSPSENCVCVCVCVCVCTFYIISICFKVVSKDPHYMSLYEYNFGRTKRHTENYESWSFPLANGCNLANFAWLFSISRVPILFELFVSLKNNKLASIPYLAWHHLLRCIGASREQAQSVGKAARGSNHLDTCSAYLHV